MRAPHRGRIPTRRIVPPPHPWRSRWHAPDERLTAIAAISDMLADVVAGIARADPVTQIHLRRRWLHLRYTHVRLERGAS